MSAKPKVFVTRIIPAKGLQMVQEAWDVDLWTDDLPPSRDIMLQRVRGVAGLLCLLTDRVDGELPVAAGPQLKVVSNHAVGFDNIVVPDCTARGIPVGNTPGILTDATADFAFALLMAAARRVVEADRYVRTGQWKTWGPSVLLGSDFVGATLGIVGYGRIGQAMARRALGFDLRVIYYDPTAIPEPNDPAQKVSLETLLSESDFISLHTPLSPATRHLMDARAFAQMKQNAVLVNTARGPIIDQMALYDALKTGRIFAAALDVTDPEPLPMDSPLLELENLIIVPHIASASQSTRDKMAMMAAANLIAGVQGQRLPNCINPQVYDR
ncbi:MAG: D-glycerate dehydrogenase [Anaerolineales bacterium]|nr:D-glycerate dehydrogenase [Anaerolineales bacterium]